jgi:hypothetical protein
MAVRLSALRAGHPLTSEDSSYSFLLDAESTPVKQYGWKDSVNLKNVMSSSGIETATFRLVLSASTNYATMCPRHPPHIYILCTVEYLLYKVHLLNGGLTFNGNIFVFR